MAGSGFPKNALIPDLLEPQPKSSTILFLAFWIFTADGKTVVVIIIIIIIIIIITIM